MLYPNTMLRLLALFVFLVGVGFGYEEYTGNSVGIKNFLRTVGSIVMPGSGYGVTTGGATNSVGALQGLGSRVGGFVGN